VPDADSIKQEIVERNRPLGDEDLPPPPNRPARERHAYRKILNHAVRRAAGTILHRLDIPEGNDLAATVGTGEEESNIEVVIRMLHRHVNEAVGRDDETEGRNEWPLATLKDAKETVPEVRDAVIDRIETATTYGLDTTPDAAPSSKNKKADNDQTDGTWAANEVDWGDPF